jgi:hypothetical protein
MRQPAKTALNPIQQEMEIQTLDEVIAAPKGGVEISIGSAES